MMPFDRGWRTRKFNMRQIYEYSQKKQRVDHHLHTAADQNL